MKVVDSSKACEHTLFFFDNSELEVLGGVKIVHDRSWSVERGEKAMVKSVRELEVEDLVNAGLTLAQANELYGVLRDILSHYPSHSDSDSDNHPSLIWRHLVSLKLLKPSFPHSLHHLLFHSVYHSAFHTHHASLPLYWFPSL